MWLLWVQIIVTTWCLSEGTRCFPGGHATTMWLQQPTAVATYPTEALCLEALVQRRNFADVPTIVRPQDGAWQQEQNKTSWCAPRAEHTVP